MRRTIVYLFFLLVPAVSFCQADQDSLWIRDNYTKVEQYIPMRDGVKLFTAIYLPKDQSEKHPILMTRTPYSCAPYGKILLHVYGLVTGNIMQEKIISSSYRM